MLNPNCKLTFRDLDPSGAEDQADCALVIWYRGVLDVPFGTMRQEDVARSCRQKLYLDALVPCILSRLEKKPLQGDQWPGGLMESLTHVTGSYWEKYPEQLRRFLPILEEAYFALEDEDLDWNGAIARRKRGDRS